MRRLYTIRKALYVFFALVALIFFVVEACQPEGGNKQEPTSTTTAQGEPEKAKPAANKKKNSKKKDKKEKKSKDASKKTLKKLKALVVAPESRDGYERESFEHWSDLDGNGCDSREDVLARENLKPKSKVCYVLADEGSWFSVYDGVETTDSGTFDVDHLVPLAEAWDSGASKWSDEERESYANDLKHGTLIAVSATSNRSKSDQDPAEWLPPLPRAHCKYAASWIKVKSHWELTIDSAEKKTLKGIIKECSKKKLRTWPSP